jgi:hypothetical protein
MNLELGYGAAGKVHRISWRKVRKTFHRDSECYADKEQQVSEYLKSVNFPYLKYMCLMEKRLNATQAIYPYFNHTGIARPGYGMQLALVLDELVKYGVVHGDSHDSNVLWNRHSFVLIDFSHAELFGIATQFDWDTRVKRGIYQYLDILSTWTGVHCWSERETYLETYLHNKHLWE